MKTIKTMTYKGHKIESCEDAFGQPFVYVDGDKSKDYCSVADAKRVIRGEKPMFETFKMA